MPGRLVITGDVHHRTMGGDDQDLLEGTEAEAAITYAEIVEAEGLRVTLFVSGLTCVLEPHLVAELADREGVHLGGHNWSCLHPAWLHRAFHVGGLSYYGPSTWVRRDIIETLEAIRVIDEKSGRAWRNHGFVYCTRAHERELSRAGVRVLANTYDLGALGPARHGELVVLPTNVLMDHGHLIHGPSDMAREGGAGRGWHKTLGRRILGGASPVLPLVQLGAEEWLHAVKTGIMEVLGKGGLPSLLVHPGCMKIVDDFVTFRALCRWIRIEGLETLFVEDCVELA